jgi:TMEM175 potassium channel family protein
LDSLLPKFVGYFLAFFLLAILLNIHNRQFNNLKYADQYLWWLNIVFLTFIVLVPFVTSIWTEYGDTTIGVLFFHFNMLISGFILYYIWAYAKNHKYLLRKDITSRTLLIITYRNLAIPIASIIAIVLAFFTPILSNIAYALILLIIFITPILIKKKK